MENLQTNEKYNFLKKFKFYALLGVLTVTTSLGALVSCGKKKHPTPSTPTPTTIDNPVSPTDIVTPTSEITVTPTGISVTPTATVTPEPTITVAPTVTPTPTPAISETKISSTDMWSKEFAETEFFDTNKPVEEQIEDRKNYLESKEDTELNSSDINTLVKCVNKEATGEAMTQEEINSLSGIVKKVFDYNQSHPEDMIAISVLGTDLTQEEKVLYNDVQCISYEMTCILPPSASLDDVYAYKAADFYTHLSYGGALSISTKDGDQATSKYISLKSMDSSCRIITYMYAIEALKPYTYNNTDMRIRSTCIKELLDAELANMKTAESPAPQLTK